MVSNSTATAGIQAPVRLGMRHEGAEVNGLLMPKTVLIVDDNETIRHALCRIFAFEAGFEVCGEAENGKEAIEKAQELRTVYRSSVGPRYVVLQPAIRLIPS
jgi:CheY-like chemotaxis protein